MSELEALEVRYRALAKDWNRLRDIEYQWVNARNTVLRVGALVGVIFFFSVITGAI